MYNQLFYSYKPFVPRRLQILFRKVCTRYIRLFSKNSWPIDEKAAQKPEGWKGWPEGKKFALVITHDVETCGGHEKCKLLVNLEKEMEFRSSFNFTPERYIVSPDLRKYLTDNGFEVGIHGLKHDGKLYKSRDIFSQRAEKINQYMKDWQTVGFRSPAMHHNLEWIHDLNILYDASTFDTDPFEPQPDGMQTIFPFYVSNEQTGRGYIELPYTIPQDFTLFILMRKKNIDIWKRKLNWLVKHGGMALINVHPDYMNFGGRNTGYEEYPIKYYREFLDYIIDNYSGRYWHVLPREMAVFWRREVLQIEDK